MCVCLFIVLLAVFCVICFFWVFSLLL